MKNIDLNRIKSLLFCMLLLMC